MKLFSYVYVASVSAGNPEKTFGRTNVQPRRSMQFGTPIEQTQLNIDDARYPKELLKRLAAKGMDVSHFTPQEPPMSDMIKNQARGALSGITQWYEKMDINGVDKTILPWSFMTDFPHKDAVRGWIEDMNKDLGCVHLYEVPENQVSTAGAPFTHGVMVGWEFDGDGCWSNTGVCQGCSNPTTHGAPSTWQMIALGSGCAAETNPRPTKHEFIHALGFLHEQQRPDAHEFLNFDTTGLEDYWASQYNQMDAAAWLDMTQYPYEAMSLMHYGSGTNGNGAPVMTYLDGTSFSAPTVMTTTDALQIQTMYCSNIAGYEYKETTQCPSADRHDLLRPIFRDRVCDGILDCTGGEDEIQDGIAHCLSFGTNTANGCCEVYTIDGKECSIHEESGSNGRDTYHCDCGDGNICRSLVYSSGKWFYAAGESLTGSYYTFTESDAMCPPNAVWSGFNSYAVQCKWGGAEFGDGDQCLDNNCDPNATCTDKYQDFQCSCNDGYFGNGTTCEELILVNECETGENNCHADASCTDTVHGYECACNAGLVDAGETPGTDCTPPPACCKTFKFGYSDFSNYRFICQMEFYQYPDSVMHPTYKCEADPDFTTNSMGTV